MDLSDKAKDFIGRIELQRARRKLEESGRRQQRENQDAVYLDFDSEAGSHILAVGDRIVAADMITNAGQKTGDRGLWQSGNYDAMPRVKGDNPIDPVLGDEEITWALLVKHLKIDGYTTEFDSGRSAIIRPASPASYSIMFYADGFPAPEARTRLGLFWVGSGSPIRYGYGHVRNIGGTYAATNIDREDYTFLCRFNYGSQWRFCSDRALYGSFRRRGPDLLFTTQVGINEFGQAVHEGFGYVIGALLVAADGESGAPNLGLLPQKPRFFRRIESESARVNGSWQPGTRYSSCDVEYGEEYEIEWIYLETIPFTEYRPAELIAAERPAQFVQRPNYFEDYWLLSNKGLIKICAIPRYNQRGRTTFEIQARLSIDESGVIHADFRHIYQKTENINTIDEQTTDVTELLHYTINQGVVEKVETPTSWRAPLTGNENWEVAGTTTHPCISPYIFDQSVNLFLQKQKIIKIDKIPVDGSEPRHFNRPPLTDQLEYSIYRLPPISDTRCITGLQDIPTQRKITVPKLDPEAIAFETPNRSDPLRPDPRNWSFIAAVVWDEQ